MIELKNVTLICVEGDSEIEKINKSIKVMEHSSLNIEFAEKILLSPSIDEDTLNKLNISGIKYHEIEKMDWIGYNNFILKNLNEYIKTDFCLIIQWDGFILNPNLWTDDFLKFDYIGAKWDSEHLKGCNWLKPEIKKNGIFNLVGNGGFSLRSKKLLIETANAPFVCDGPEDAYICNNNYEYFIDKGIKFGTNEIADKFSREMNKSLEWDSVFGFHGEKEFINKI